VAKAQRGRGRCARADDADVQLHHAQTLVPGGPPARRRRPLALPGWLTLTHTQRCHAHWGSAGSGHLYPGAGDDGLDCAASSR
jgi:hypothetical protein